MIIIIPKKQYLQKIIFAKSNIGKHKMALNIFK